jgi:hypothetical protein
VLFEETTNPSANELGECFWAILFTTTNFAQKNWHRLTYGRVKSPNGHMFYQISVMYIAYGKIAKLIETAECNLPLHSIKRCERRYRPFQTFEKIRNETKLVVYTKIIEKTVEGDCSASLQ